MTIDVLLEYIDLYIVSYCFSMFNKTNPARVVIPVCYTLEFCTNGIYDDDYDWHEQY